MIITHHNIEFFKIQFGDIIIAFNPISKNSKFKGPRFGADIVLVSANREDFNGVDNVTSKNKDLFVVDGPGEYEIGGIFIKGALSSTGYGGKDGINTVYSLVVDGIKIGFLGALGSKDLDDNAKSILADTDILFVPIGGEGVLNPAEAHGIATKLGSKIMIPMHFGDVGEKDALKKFLKEGGDESLKAEEKLTIKKKDLIDKKGEIVILSTQS